MKLSRNALRNLANRYRAVLKKCRLVNTFGSLAVAAMLVMGVGENVLAYGPGEASDKNITYNSTSGPLPDIVYGGEATGDWGNGAVDASRNSLIIEGRNDDVNGIYGGKADTRYPDSAKRSQALNNNVSIKQSTITVKGNKIGFDQGEIDISVIGGYAGKEANNNSVNIDSGTFSGVVIGGMATGKNGKAVGNSVNLSGGILTGGAFNDEQIAVVGGYANAGSLQNNTVQISGTAKVTGNVYAIYCQSSPDKTATTISGEVIITGQEEHSSPDLSQSSLYGYNKTHPLYGMKDRIDLVAKIENFDGTIKNIGQFTTVTVTGSTLKVENVDCAVETSYGSFERSVFTGNNSNITITGSIKNFNEFKIDNTKDNTVEIHSIKGFSKSIANIQSGTVILHNGISTPYQGKFTINDAEGSASFTTQITGNLSNEQEGSISASFNTKESFLTGTADKGTGTTTLAFANGARWNMTGNSTLSGLNLNGSGTVDGEGTVDLTSGRTGSATNARTLTLDTLDGDGGTFRGTPTAGNGTCNVPPAVKNPPPARPCWACRAWPRPTPCTWASSPTCASAWARSVTAPARTACGCAASRRRTHSPVWRASTSARTFTARPSAMTALWSKTKTTSGCSACAASSPRPTSASMACMTVPATAALTVWQPMPPGSMATAGIRTPS